MRYSNVRNGDARLAFACRSGPDLAYSSVSVLAFGASTPVAGRTADASWWYVQDPANPAGYCWVSSSVVTIAGPTRAIPVAALPPAIATQVIMNVSAQAARSYSAALHVTSPNDLSATKAFQIAEP